MPSYRSYWSNETRYPVIADAMSSRSKSIFISTTILPRNHEETLGNDKIHKVRPLIEMIRDNFMKIPPEEHQAVDEQIVPTKQRISLKQYNPKKPHKWGYKFISRAGESGFVYDFEGMSGRLNFRWGSFNFKLEVIVPFLRVKIGLRASNLLPPTSSSPQRYQIQNLEMAIRFIVVEGSRNYVSEEETPPPQLLGQGL